MNMHMQWRRRDVTIASRPAEASFRLTGEDKAECIEGVETLKYLGWMLDRSDGNCLAILWNVGKAHRVWIQLGKFIREEGADP